MALARAHSRRAAVRYFAEGWSREVDGPGRRWVLYLHGCQLSCGWCASPDSFLAPGERGEGPRVREVDGDGLLVAAAERRPLFTGGGGITFSGGEPSLQATELVPAIARLRAERIHCAIESNVATAAFPSIIAAPDLLICDCKHVDDHALAGIGARGGRVRDNLRRAAGEAESLWVRVPLVPGFNDDPASQEAIAAFLAGLGRSDLRLDLLRMHHGGAAKYDRLDRVYPMRGLQTPSHDEAAVFAARLQAHGIACRCEVTS